MTTVSFTSQIARADGSPHPSADPSLASCLGFVDHVITANGVRLHYVTVGTGEPVVLLPGWPEDWYAWRYVMKQMAENGREVYALDPRGFGTVSDPRTAMILQQRPRTSTPLSKP